MAHEVETMFYVRETPWHGLGVRVEEAPTSEEAIRLAGLDWTVDSQPVFTEKGFEIPNYKANIRSSDNKVLGIVTDKYKIVQNKDAFAFTDSLIGEGCTYETAGSLFGGKKVFLLAKMPEQKILGDDFDPYICFCNTHDGTGSVRAFMTPVRVVCNNTLSLALDTAKRAWSTRHVGNLEQKMEEAKHTLQMAETYMQEFAKTADKMANIEMTQEEQAAVINTLFTIDDEMSDRQKQNINDKKEQFMVCMFAPDILKFKGTAYQMVQAASDFATHMAPKRMTETYQERNFDKILNGRSIIDTTFLKILEKYPTISKN